MEVTLQHLAGSKMGQTQKFPGQRILVGRNPGSTLEFDPYQDLDVSGEHAQFTIGQDGKLHLTDLGSTNGTFLNGQQLSGGASVPVEPGSKVKFGKNGPEVRVDYVPEASAEKKEIEKLKSEMAAKEQQQAASKKKMVIVGCILGGVLLIGGVTWGLLSSRAAKREAAQQAIAQAIEAKEAADDEGAKKHAAPGYKNASDLEDQANLLLEQGEYEQAQDLAEQARAEYREVAKVGEIMREAHDQREEATEKFFAHQFQPDLLAEADGLIDKAKKAMKEAKYDDAKKLGEQALAKYKTAGALAYEAGVKMLADEAQAKAREDAERELRELREAAERAEEARQREITRLEEEMRKATGAKLAELEATTNELRNRLPIDVRVRNCIKLAEKKIALIETKLYVVVEDVEQAFPIAPTLGTGFLYEGGHLVTAKQTLKPELFDPVVAGIYKLTKQNPDYSVKAKHRVWVYIPSKQQFQEIFSSEKGNLDYGFAAPDKMLESKQKVKVPFSETIFDVEVQVHDPKLNNIASLKLSGPVPSGLPGADSEPDLQDVVVAVGTVREKDTLSVSPVRTNLARRVEGLYELPTTFEAPVSIVGSPVLNLEGELIGMLVWVGKAKVFCQPVTDIDALLK